MTIDWQLLWDMNGHGPYVWASYGMALALLGAEALSLWHRHRQHRRRHSEAQHGGTAR